MLHCTMWSFSLIPFLFYDLQLITANKRDFSTTLGHEWGWIRVKLFVLIPLWRGEDSCSRYVIRVEMGLFWLISRCLTLDPNLLPPEQVVFDWARKTPKIYSVIEKRTKTWFSEIAIFSEFETVEVALGSVSRVSVKRSLCHVLNCCSYANISVEA